MRWPYLPIVLIGVNHIFWMNIFKDERRNLVGKLRLAVVFAWLQAIEYTSFDDTLKRLEREVTAPKPRYGARRYAQR
jgi:hypothetical protein